ncbi:MAG: hypothetical protein R6W06_12210 [Prochlorococcaceae cyanobacterium]
MKITADTNVLVRALVQDDPGQARAASDLLEQAELVASASVRTDRPAVRAGLQLLAAASLGATNWRPLTRRQRGFWLQPESRCIC